MVFRLPRHNLFAQVGVAALFYGVMKIKQRTTFMRTDSEASVIHRVTRYDGAIGKAVDDVLVKEEPLEIRVAGRTRCRDHANAWRRSRPRTGLFVRRRNDSRNRRHRGAQGIAGARGMPEYGNVIDVLPAPGRHPRPRTDPREPTGHPDLVGVWGMRARADRRFDATMPAPCRWAFRAGPRGFLPHRIRCANRSACLHKQEASTPLPALFGTGGYGRML